MFTRTSDIGRISGAMDLLRNRMDRFFSDFDRSCWENPAFALASHSPRTNLFDNGDTFDVQTEVPGISKENLNIKIQGNYLEISGKSTIDSPDGYKVHRNERGSRSFSRSFTLPGDVNADKAEAILKDGILCLKLPKLDAAKPKQITIN